MIVVCLCSDLIFVSFSHAFAYTGSETRPTPTTVFLNMGEHQDSLDLDVSYNREPTVIPELRDEIAHTWGLPLGERVEVCFRGSQRAGITGVLELLSTPDYPWDARQPLQLRMVGLVFSSREIERWTRI